jgi:hypothetical protein
MGYCYLLVIFIERDGLLEVGFLRSSHSVTCSFFQRKHADGSKRLTQRGNARHWFCFDLDVIQQFYYDKL